MAEMNRKCTRNYILRVHIDFFLFSLDNSVILCRVVFSYKQYTENFDSICRTLCVNKVKITEY